MKIIDCFIFYNELDMLKFRLEYLYDAVDYFVLVEATSTYTGNSKQLIFNENKHMFSKYLDKIIHVIVDDMPTKQPFSLRFIRSGLKHIPLAELREHHQRTCISRGISQLNLSPNDIIIISDVDEIPDKNTLKSNLATIKNYVIYALVQDMYYYNLNIKAKSNWILPKVLNYKTYAYSNLTPQQLRVKTPDVLIYKGGWHFSYFGDINFISNKLKNFCHTEYNTPEFTNYENIQNRIKNGIPITGEKTEFIPVNTNNYLPDNYEELLNISLNKDMT